ncbi:hypothetical protein DH2020_007669 [Rehmannia glutinosa]|uniref:Uncharacterized protein n=1 Tax=Rehmannia glutinosa TaxID=99300 RepID=A0ABR0TYS6_REHGL
MKLALKLSYCPVERKPCIRWIDKLFKDCLCNLKDEISFGLGIASLLGWAVAEIPQIITNFNNKSANGVSIAFLSTWIIGDFFNLVGCIFEPATLPTQFYTAVVKDETEPLEPTLQDRLKAKANTPVEVPRRRDFYFMSARSLAGSDTPPSQYYIKARSGPPVLDHHTHSSSDEEEEDDPSIFQPSPITQPRPIPRQARYGTFVAASANLPHLSRALRRAHVIEFSGLKLLQIKRGSVEGLNPLMFVFALVANATYVGSILVRSSEWGNIKANMPWLLDAIVCVLLDLFVSSSDEIHLFHVLLCFSQFIYYNYIKLKKREHYGDYRGDYVQEADKPTF